MGFIFVRLDRISAANTDPTMTVARSSGDSDCMVDSDHIPRGVSHAWEHSEHRPRLCDCVGLAQLDGSGWDADTICHQHQMDGGILDQFLWGLHLQAVQGPLRKYHHSRVSKQQPILAVNADRWTSFNAFAESSSMSSIARIGSREMT